MGNRAERYKSGVMRCAKIRQEVDCRNIRYTPGSYATREPEGQRYK